MAAAMKARGVFFWEVSCQRVVVGIVNLHLEVSFYHLQLRHFMVKCSAVWTSGAELFEFNRKNVERMIVRSGSGIWCVALGVQKFKSGLFRTFKMSRWFFHFNAVESAVDLHSQVLASWLALVETLPFMWCHGSSLPGLT